MSKYIVSVFDEEKAAYDGARALGQLYDEGSIAVYEGAVLAKDASGEVRVLDGLEEAPFGTLGGMLLGSLVGVLGGPAGMVMGAAAGSLSGMFMDLNIAGVGDEFLDDVARELSPGSFAVVAEVEEGWTMPLDTRMEALGGTVYRSWRIDVEDAQIERDIEATNREIDELKQEWKQGSDEAKAKLQAKVDAAKAKLQGLQDRAKKKVETLQQEVEAKARKLDEQIAKADGDFKNKLEKARADLKTVYEQRATKLKEAGALAAEALT
jgi:uncharacterized membrane protein